MDPGLEVSLIPVRIDLDCSQSATNPDPPIGTNFKPIPRPKFSKQLSVDYFHGSFPEMKDDSVSKNIPDSIHDNLSSSYTRPVALTTSPIQAKYQMHGREEISVAITCCQTDPLAAESFESVKFVRKPAFTSGKSFKYPALSPSPSAVSTANDVSSRIYQLLPAAPLYTSPTTTLASQINGPKVTHLRHRRSSRRQKTNSKTVDRSLILPTDFLCGSTVNNDRTNKKNIASSDDHKAFDTSVSLPSGNPLSLSSMNSLDSSSKLNSSMGTRLSRLVKQTGVSLDSSAADYEKEDAFWSNAAQEYGLIEQERTNLNSRHLQPDKSLPLRVRTNKTSNKENQQQHSTFPGPTYDLCSNSSPLNVSSGECSTRHLFSNQSGSYILNEFSSPSETSTFQQYAPKKSFTYVAHVPRSETDILYGLSDPSFSPQRIGNPDNTDELTDYKSEQAIKSLRNRRPSIPADQNESGFKVNDKRQRHISSKFIEWSMNAPNIHSDEQKSQRSLRSSGHLSTRTYSITTPLPPFCNKNRTSSMPVSDEKPCELVRTTGKARGTHPFIQNIKHWLNRSNPFNMSSSCTSNQSSLEAKLSLILGDPPDWSTLDNPGLVFGRPLEEQICSPDILFVPVFLQAFFFALELHGLTLTGLYRKSGRQRTIAQFVCVCNLAPFNANLITNLDAWNEPYALCGLVKTFLRRLPTGLLPHAAWDPLALLVPGVETKPTNYSQSAYLLLAIRVQLKKMALRALHSSIRNTDDENSLKETKSKLVFLYDDSLSNEDTNVLVSKSSSSKHSVSSFKPISLDSSNSCAIWRWCTLCYFVSHIQRIVSYKHVNSVSYQCAAICFGPVLFPLSSDLPKMNKILEILFEHWSWLVDGFPFFERTLSSSIPERSLDEATKYLQDTTSLNVAVESESPDLAASGSGIVDSSGQFLQHNDSYEQSTAKSDIPSLVRDLFLRSHPSESAKPIPMTNSVNLVYGTERQRSLPSAPMHRVVSSPDDSEFSKGRNSRYRFGLRRQSLATTNLGRSFDSVSSTNFVSGKIKKLSISHSFSDE